MCKSWVCIWPHHAPQTPPTELVGYLFQLKKNFPCLLCVSVLYALVFPRTPGEHVRNIQKRRPLSVSVGTYMRCVKVFTFNLWLGGQCVFNVFFLLRIGKPNWCGLIYLCMSCTVCRACRAVCIIVFIMSTVSSRTCCMRRACRTETKKTSAHIQS